MNRRSRSGIVTSLTHNIVLRLVAYYAALAGAGWAIWTLLPADLRQLISATLAPIIGAQALEGLMSKRDVVDKGITTVPFPALAEGVSMLCAFLIALPMSWVYMFTRQKKGYRQSTVHSLVLLPVVVAGVVAMVKYSLALAFSLAGIVAAVRFRNTLDDSRDAVYLFLATALGLTAAVQADVALVLSIVFNAIVLGLWYTDFARTPPSLEGDRARRMLDRSLALANRTSQFVAQVDRDILRSMAPAQLDAMQERIKRARGGMADGALSKPPRYNARLRITVTDAEAARAAIEPTLAPHAKRWRYRGTETDDDGLAVLAYDVRLRRGKERAAVETALSQAGAPYVVRTKINSLSARTGLAEGPRQEGS